MSEQQPRRLTYFITGLQYGGANTGMARLLSELQPSEFDITVVAIADTPPDVVSMLPDHVEVKHLKMTPRTGLLQLGKIAKIVQSTDILVCSLFHATAVGVPLGILFRVPNILVWQHSTSYSNRIRSMYYRLAYRAADHVLADSEAVREMLVESNGIPDRKISTLPIAGIDTNRFKPGPEAAVEQTKVGTIGRLAEQKGYWDLLETATRTPDFEFHVIGDGPLYSELVQHAPKNVEFHGRVDDDELVSLLQQMTVYFQPSKYEGLCMTVIEAMACELPIVASAVGGITESVVPEETGFLCQPGEIGCFSERLQQLGENPDLRTEMGRAGRERVISRYSQKALARQFRDVVEQTETV